MIAIIDYGMGNLRSVLNAFRHFKADAKLTRDKKEIVQADGVVLPGVGAFRDCMTNLLHFDFSGPIHEVIDKGAPFLGICLGLQLLFTESTEFGRTEGLNIVEGTVERFPFGHPSDENIDGPRLKVPHMGWNNLKIRSKAPNLEGVPDGAFVYFVHSYYVKPKDPDVIATTTDYGFPFVSSIWKDNVFATQFHPEKSQKYGLKMIENFIRIVASQ